jgi:hypothetical protein
VKESEGLEL